MHSNSHSQQHYFIEILPDFSIAYGSLRNLKQYSHTKMYFKNASEFYLHLDQNNALSELKTLLFFHGWICDRPYIFSGYIHHFNQEYIIPKKIDHTISVIWHTGMRDYLLSKKYVPKIACAFQKDFETFNQYLLKNQQPTFLLCHSMGNYLFQNLVSEIKMPQLGFQHYIMAAPDLDCDVFEKGEDFENLPTLIPQITLLRHQNDRTLGVSRILLRRNRLGRHGFVNDTPSVKTIDVTQFPTTSFKDNFTHHLYMYKCPKVVEIIGALFE